MCDITVATFGLLYIRFLPARSGVQLLLDWGFLTGPSHPIRGSTCVFNPTLNIACPSKKHVCTIKASSQTLVLRLSCSVMKQSAFRSQHLGIGIYICVDFVDQVHIASWYTGYANLHSPYLISITGVPYTVHFDSASDVFSLVSPQDSELRRA